MSLRGMAQRTTLSGGCEVAVALRASGGAL